MLLPGHSPTAIDIDIPPSVFTDTFCYIDTARKGLPGSVIKQAVHALGNRDLFVSLLNTDKANLSRFYTRKNLDRTQSESILDMLRVYEKASAVFGGYERANEWLNSHIPALGGEKPIDICDTFQGRALVVNVLQKVEYGEFS